MHRVLPSAPLSPMQYAVTMLLGVGESHASIAETLHISVANVRAHMRYAAAKIPGDLPREAKLVAWARGATLDVLEGTVLRGEFMRDAQRGVVTAEPHIAKLAPSL